MTFSEKTTLLKNEIKKILLPLINHDYWYLEIPYYTNVGDILIWEGTRTFLRNCNVHCKYETSRETFKPRPINSDTIILLQGGGGFGDLWGGQPFRRKIITEYPDNRVIILPQTVFYNDHKTLLSDAELFNQHNNLIICARDMISYEILKKHFKAEIVLVPDMAFCIPIEWLKKQQCQQTEKTLFLKRNDKELNQIINYQKYISEKPVDIHDWPVMEKTTMSTRFLLKFIQFSHILPFPFLKLTDMYALSIFKNDMIKKGVRFLSSYSKVYTTRLHIAILCCLLEKPFIFFNNSYGKNKGFYETWLQDVEEIMFYAE
jgi:pyruvyl transferase EpsO